MRLDPVLVFGAACLLGTLGIAAPVPALTAGLSGFLLLRCRVERRALAAAAIGILLTAARARHAVVSFEGALEAAREKLGAPRRCAGPARIETSPVRRAGAVSFVARFESLDCEGSPQGSIVARVHGDREDLARGDRAEIVAQLASVESFKNADLPDPVPRAARARAVLSGAALSVSVLSRAGGLPALIDRARAVTRARIERTFPVSAAPLARALVLGESDLSESDDAAFRASGLSHLLAVSGTHLVCAILGIVHALSFVLVRIERWAARIDVRRVASLVGAVLSPLYADFAGGSGSAWRAAVMLSLALAVRALGRAPSTTRAFAFSLVWGALWDPLIGFDISFLLSAAATSGLLLWSTPLARRFSPPGSGAPRKIVGGSVAATLAAMIPCAPLLATLGPRLTLAGLVANVVAAPFGELVSLPLCLLHAVTPVEACARGIGLVSGGALLVVRSIARLSAAASWLAVPVPPPGAWHFTVLGVGSLGALVASKRGTRAAVVLATLLAIIVVEAAAVSAGHPRGVLRVTVLDVGQGDATLVDLPDGSLLLVDGGGIVGSPVDPGTAVVLPVLRARRRERVDWVVLSHPHPDHFLGLASALPQIAVGQFWDTGQGREEGAFSEYRALLAGLESRAVPILGPSKLCGHARSLGGAELSVLDPCPHWDPLLGANDNSFVLRIAYRGHVALLMGDAERAEEAHVLAHGGDLHAEFLKAGHHGSRTSTSAELLANVRPRVATISCGVRNRFGHPHAATLQTLESAGVTFFRTDRSGSIEWTAGPGPVQVRLADAGAHHPWTPVW